MAIDYTLDLRCEPKRKLGREGLSHRLRMLEDLQTELNLTPGQTASVREVVFELRPLAFHCARCPANHRNREFGCFGRVETPISQEAEEWLVDLLPATLRPAETESREVRAQAGAASSLIERFARAGVDGRAVDERRPRGTRSPVGGEPAFTEARQSLLRKYGKLFRGPRLTTSQLLEALLLRGAVPPEMGEAICRALGVWQDGGEGQDGVPEVVFTQPIEGDDDTSTGQLKLFLYACIVAASLNAGVLTELHVPGTAPVPEPVG